MPHSDYYDGDKKKKKKKKKMKDNPFKRAMKRGS